MASKHDVPGARHLSSKAKELWRAATTSEAIPHTRQVVYNIVHEFCFAVCRKPSCDGCQVVNLRSWLAGMKDLPSNLGTPVIREIDKKLSKKEAACPEIDTRRFDGTSEA